MKDAEIGQVAITVSDVARVLPFYRDVLGLKLTARMPDHELWIGFLRDPDGNLVGLMEERRVHEGKRHER